MKSRIRTRVYNYTLYVQTSHFQIFAADEFLGVDEFESFFFFLFLLFLYFHIFPERKVKMSSDIWRTLSSSSQLSLNVIMTEVVTLHKKELRECGEVQFLTFPAGWVLCEGWLSGIYRWVFHSRPGRWTSPTEWTVPVTVVKTGNNKSYYFGWLTRKQK